jgi:signal recognition particle subunit SEC65
VMVPQASVCESKLEAMEIQLRRMARKGDRSMRRIQKEMAVMSIKQKEVAKNVDKLASDMMILESKMENMEVAKEEDMEIEKE